MALRAVAGIRRWRHNPLCRPTDRHEAWLALTALLLMLVAAPLLGHLCASRTGEALRETVRAQHAQRHRATAVVVRESPGGASSFDGLSEGAVAEGGTRTSVVAEWRAPDGTVRTGTVPAPADSAVPGTRIRIWTDDRGGPAPRPMDATAARTHAVLAGVGAALLTTGAVEAARRVVLRGMTRRRYARIDRAWARTGPDWGRTGAGS
ncbi:hypothetical protein ABT098_21075 [Streptomyces nitrosporeus]